jgi:hypothetical protein
MSQDACTMRRLTSRYGLGVVISLQAANTLLASVHRDRLLHTSVSFWVRVRVEPEGTSEDTILHLASVMFMLAR